MVVQLGSKAGSLTAQTLKVHARRDVHECTQALHRTPRKTFATAALSSPSYLHSTKQLELFALASTSVQTSVGIGCTCLPVCHQTPCPVRLRMRCGCLEGNGGVVVMNVKTLFHQAIRILRLRVWALLLWQRSTPPFHLRTHMGPHLQSGCCCTCFSDQAHGVRQRPVQCNRMQQCITIPHSARYTTRHKESMKTKHTCVGHVATFTPVPAWHVSRLRVNTPINTTWYVHTIRKEHVELHQALSWHVCCLRAGVSLRLLLRGKYASSVSGTQKRRLDLCATGRSPHLCGNQKKVVSRCCEPRSANNNNIACDYE